ncbi:uncharacterized protein LOC18422536 isoform X2 [Amborella trichopoda]|uniref:uncharacterized protein LOC18422536 isoform X2 n=1 Tax=Amborella trichopoda TaxID=13333 RepID=UPI0009BFCAA9|nr:uncharacterized protein LOC18422536 isoform X2 [Amborella trichopoda]|eukprot:XP_020524274.1 uncharacterized protein LOC18422536 isoform X2 [Amborella trichopoda]
MGAEELASVVVAEKEAPPPPPLVIGLQPSALVDHVARVDWALLHSIPGERGGSQQVGFDDLKHILNEVNSHILPSPEDLSPVRTMAGGSVANTIRGLAAGLGISCGIVGACGDDEQGCMFVHNMSSNGVSISRLRVKKGPTGQCVCLVDALGNRTMRPCLSTAVKLQWLALRYGYYNLELIRAAIRLAKQEGTAVSLDLASFEMVRNFRSHLLEILKSGQIDLCFANEDEARELMRGEPNSDPESALGFLSRHCKWAVVTLGSKGSIAKHGKEIVRVPAIGEARAIDATGAGDLFASGFLYGMIRGLSLEDCCKVGSCSGGSVIRALGGEVRLENWQWMYKELLAQGLPLPDLTDDSTILTKSEKMTT